MIKPQPGTLEFAEVKHPTLRGDILVKFTNVPEESFQLEVEIPANTTADVYLPYFSKQQRVQINYQPTRYQRKENFTVIENIGSGKWTFTVVR